jgi:lipoprotein-anchoring transpeptidase ErfK/SrfK
MRRSGVAKSVTGNLSAALVGAALVCFFSTPIPAQPRPPANFEPTMADVPPGVDHGNSDDDLPEQFQRRAVFYRSQHPVGTVIIDTAERHLYLIESETRALRYGLGIGRDGFGWAGLKTVSRKIEWPTWQVPPDLIARDPELPHVLAGGPGNPLGARAMVLGNPNYSIHGTNAPETIGQALIWGCFRLTNEDVIDLYDRVAIGTRVIVRQN